MSGRVALVFGGGQLAGEDTGNGRAAAQLFASHGARVAVVDRNLDSARETVELIDAAGGEALALRADVSDETDVVAAIEVCRQRFGAIDVLHNNVGIGVGAGDAPLDEIEIDPFDRIMRVNLGGIALACRHTLPVMRDQGRGVVINISSIAAHIDYPYAAYKVSKSAVIALTKHLAITQATHGIRANAILPGLVNTPMAIEYRVAQGQPREDVLAAREARIPLSHVGTAWDIANAALFLASDEAAFITGAELVVDGGQSLRVG